ncbi:hypothetical protein JYK00_05675 [Thermosipho ferrireducens]|uniref:Uncharacterized protein n=1 Tax=Thermosipho ferrireducens TaxID=2571116 RepID=A0ABX7S7I7_9BACT|nr:hypothetical protein [Thermosipho ferrireducens]QTA37233.1 hypothetical protein JYK00_05675 [Thermosipho ferrireducens]
MKRYAFCFFIFLLFILSGVGFSEKFSLYNYLINSKVSILRECDESLTEPVTYAICVRYEDSDGYLDQNCFGICTSFCDTINNF